MQPGLRIYRWYGYRGQVRAAYVTGGTESSDFPTTPGAYDRTFAYSTWDDHSDVFVSKLSADGSALVYSTYLGSQGIDHPAAVAVDASGAAYVTGSTGDFFFPTTRGAFDRTYNDGFRDAFVTKLSADGSALLYSTLLGGRESDYGYGLAVDASGAAYVTGATDSSNFPTAPGAFDPTFNGDYDAFVTKLSPDGSALLYSTFLGAGDEDYGRAVAVDASGAGYVTGDTGSSNFPTTPGAFDVTYNSHNLYHRDAFVTKFSADGSALVYSTFLGGSDTEWSSALALDASGAAYVTGYTESSDFPTTPDGYDRTFNSGASSKDVFVTKIAADGSALAYSTFLGGGDDEQGSALALDASGAAYITGDAFSSDFPTTPGAFDRTHSDYGDAFVTKLDIDSGTATGIDLIATASPTTVAAGGSFSVNYTVNNHTDNPVTGHLYFTAADSGGSRVGKGLILTDTTVAAQGAITGSFTQLVPANATPGVYTYTLRIGNSRRTTQDKEAFTITVTGAERAGGATAWKAAPRR